MKKTFVMIILLVPVMLSAATGIMAVTEDGKKVLLRPDYSWGYVDDANNDIEQSLSLLDFEIIPRPKNFELNRFSDDVILRLYLKNLLGNEINGYRLFLKLENAFGDSLRNLQLTAGDVVLGPGDVDVADFIWEDNQFIDDEVYDYLTNYSKNNLRLILEKVITI